MEDADTRSIFSSILSDQDWAQVPAEIGKKLHAFVNDKIEELLTANAIAETNRQNAETSFSELVDKFHETDTALLQTNEKLSSALSTIEELQNQISVCTCDITKLQTSCNKYEAEAADYRHQRNLAVTEKDELAKTLARTSAEVERLQTEVSSLTKQLQSAITAKCEAQSDANEIAHLKLSLEFKEKRLDQERSLLNNQVEVLSHSLSERTEELLNIRKDNSLRNIQLENKLTEKTQELNIALDSIKNLSEINNNLTSKVEELTAKLKLERDNDSKTHELFQQELDAQTKLANLYQSVNEQNVKQVEELTKAVSELQVLLREATEKYGDLETKHKELQLSNEEIITKKNECISMLKQELDTTTELLKNLKDDSIQKEVEEISPSASIASRLIKPGMSLTQIYTKFAQTNEELVNERQEKSRLQTYIQHIINELEEKGPLLRKQREDYENSLETIKEITQQNDVLVMDNHSLKEEAIQCKRNEGVVARENTRFKKEVADLSRQVCHLLREVEHSRNGSSTNSTDQDTTDSLSSADIITKRLVTFSDIAELQSTNQRLLAIVRELTSKQEEAESYDPAAIAQLKTKLEQLQETQNSLLEQQDAQNKMTGHLTNQRDLYKSLYEQALKGHGEDVPMHLERPFIQEREGGSQSSKVHDDSDSHSDDKIQDLESQLEKSRKEIDLLKEESETYRKEKSANEKILVDQVEEMRKEIQELTRKNCKLTSVIEMNDERFKIMQSNVEVYKNQIAALEKQNRIYSESNIKHEQMVGYLKDETLQSQTKLSKAEVRLANLEKENALIYDREIRLVKELEFIKKEAYSKNVLESNIELIKATLERNDAESRIRLEERLDEAHRECAALRRRMQEEQDRFRELSDHLKKQSNTLKGQVDEEKRESQKLRDEVTELREDLILKQNQLEDLTKKLKNAVTISDGGVTSNKHRELERMLDDSQLEVVSLKQQLKTMQETVQQHCTVAEGAESQLNVLIEEHKNKYGALEEKLKERDCRILKLEEQCSELQGELSIQGDDLSAIDLRGRLHNLEDEFKHTKIELEDTKKLLEASHKDTKDLAASLEAAENKYTHEMLLHSKDLQVLTNLKEELSSAINEIESVKHLKDQAVDALEESKKGFAFQEQFLKEEKEKLQKRFDDMDHQNNLLLDQIQNLNNQLVLLQSQTTDQNTSAADSSLNKSYTEDEVKSSEQLLKIIKFLRQEKDISVSKCEILEAEHIRLKSQYDTLTKQLEETRGALEIEHQKSEVSMVSAAKHSEVLRKVETLNAITDSNRTLRVERDSLLEQIKELTIRNTGLEEQVAPLQESNKELSLKSEALQTENVTIRAEAARWRQRANALIEKSNRTNPEDWKKLQNERENLAKQLIIERGNVSKLNDDLNTIKQDKNKLDEQLRSLRSQNNQLNEDIEKSRDVVGKLKEQISNVSQDLDNTKDANSKLLDEKQKVEMDLESKVDSITDLRNNLLAVRRIAKKYKQQCEDLTTEIDSLKKVFEEKNASESANAEKLEEMRLQLEERNSQLEPQIEKIAELTQNLSTATEEANNYKKEVDTIKQSSTEKEDRFKALFKVAKERIVSLQDQIVNLRELGRSSDNFSDSSKNGDVEKLLKEKEEIILEKQQEKEQYTAEIESLTQKINHLQRQLGQQSSKPTTSSGSSDKSTSEPPTANIKPMATNTQAQSVQIQPWRSGPETPLASIRPMSMQLRTVAVLPTSQGPSTSQGSSAVMVPPQQVHTTGPSSMEPLSNSPTSSHTEYMPATSSATPTVVGPRQVAVPPTQSTQDTEDDDNSMQVQPAPQQQAVALVLPRVEQPNNGPTQESGTSSSSNTVTTTQAGLKRPRDVDTDSCQTEEQGKTQQLSKRCRLQQGTSETVQSHGTVSDSGLEVEYQVPTSSQRDHEEDPDAVIVVESDEDGDGPDEGEGADDDQDDPDTEGYDMESYPEQELNYDDADCQDIEEEEEAGNEVEVVDDSSEVPNQSQQSIENISKEENLEQAQSEATSSGTDGTSGITVSQASPSVAVTMPSFSRTRPVAPLSRQQQSHLLLPHGIEESGDDGIVPSTPTLFVPRRSDGFGEAVSSPHVPTSGRFTFSESTTSNNSGSTEVLSEQTLEFAHADDNGTGRSVPSTPLQTSPQESIAVGDEHNSHPGGDPEIPTITVSGANDDIELGADASIIESMGPPSTAGPSGELSERSDQHAEELMDSEDGVTSEGEKPLISEEEVEEGREAEASPSTNTRSRAGVRGSGRRGMRNSYIRSGIGRPGPTPIIWNDQHSPRHSPHPHRGRGQPFPGTRVARRSRGRAPKGPYNRF